MINKINEDIKKINNELNIMKVNNININKELNITNDIQIDNLKLSENKENKLNKNEIICIYNKQEDEISLLHDYTNMNNWSEEYKKYYIEGKNNINGNNIEIYINNKKVEFNYKYKSYEKGEIKVKFIFNKLLTSTSFMFLECYSLLSIDFSSFNTTNVKDMYSMFRKCSSLKSIKLSSFNTINVNDMACMFMNCSSLISIDLSSFNTTNVDNMGSMFSGCSSLISIDLSSFNTTNVKNMGCMFLGCSSLKKENVKINKTDKKLLNEINKLEN